MNRFSFVVILFLLPLSSIYAKVVYVNQITGSDLNDGTSWGSAFKTLFYANGSLRTANGDSIWVAGAATYILTPATSNSLANSNSFYQNNKNWFGGFKGNETRINQRPLFDQDGNGVTESWEFQYPSIISVNLTDATGIVFGAGDFNGFTLTATATYSSRLNYVYALNAATRFANNIVKNCSVTLNMATTANETYNPFFRARGSVDNCLFEKNNVTVNTQNSYCYPFISIENSTTVTIGTKFTNNIVRNNKVRIDFSASSATSNSSIRGLILNVLPALQSNGLPTTVANCVIHNNDMTYVPSANNVSGSTLTNGAAISISTQNNTICTDSILNCTLVNNKGIRIKTAGIYIGFDAFSYHYILNNVFYNNQNSLDGTTFNIDNMSGSITSGVGSISNNFTNGGALNNTAGKIFNQDNTLSTNLPAFRVSTITIGATTDNSTELVDLSIGATSYLIGKGTTVNGRTLDKAGNSFQLPRSVGAYEFFQNCSIATNLATSGGTILSGDGNYNYGTLVSVVAKPGVGFHFVGWTENGNIVSTSTSYTFTVTGNRTLTASFMNNTIPLSSGTNTVSNFVNCDSCSFEVSGNGTSLEIDNNISMNSVTVNPGAKLTLNSGRTLNLESIFLRSDITGTATFVDKGTASIATANIQQYLTSGRNWYVSIPVSTTTSGSLSTASSIVYYNEPGATWNSVTAGSQLLPGRGYISVGTNANGVVNFSGSLNTGVVNVPLTRTHGVTKEGYNLVGNPYVSYLDWSKVDTAAANITPTIWYRTQNLSGSSYVFDTYNGLANIATTNGASAITNLIPPMQGFWVRVKNGFSSGNLSFNNGMRFHADVSNNQLKMPKNNDVIQSVLRLNISNGINSDETIVLFNSRASDSLDAFDSPKMMNNSASIPDLYSSVAGERLVINVLSAILDNMELPLGFSQNAAATFKFKATKMSNFPEGTHIYLRDKQENKEIELTPDTEYAFNTTAATLNNESRFSLLFKAPNSITGIINPENEQVSVFVSTQNELIILTKENTNYAIYNAVGQQIENGTLNSRLIIPNSKLNLGLYIVKVGNDSTKVIIK